MTAAPASLPPEPRPLPGWAVVGGYLLLYVLLDWVSYIRPLHGYNITPWNPQPALAIAWLLGRPRRLPWVWAGLVLAELLVRGWPQQPLGWLAVVVVQGALYAGIAHLLARLLGPLPQLQSLRQLALFVAVAAGGSLLCAVAYVGGQLLPQPWPQDLIAEAVARYWIGDFVGALVTLPVLLQLIDRSARQRLGRALRQPRVLALSGLIAALLWLVLGWRGGVFQPYFYVLFIPAVLAAAVGGVLGAVLAAGLTQLGLIAAVQALGPPDLTVFELQALMATITLTGLLVGVLVDEKARTAAALRESLRLATAGQMAAALAHELGQPLTALNNYAQACQLLAIQAGGGSERLNEVTRHIVRNATRAAEVVKRLRDFFRSGAVQLRPAPLAPLIEQLVAEHQPQAARQGVELDASVPAQLPMVWMDEVQIGVVLRNLLDNAIYAAAQGRPPRQVRLRVTAEAACLRVEVLDSGAGIEPARLATLFDGSGSDKPGGMGIGLGISRAIVQAHGGRLWAVAGAGGHFCFTLALGETEPAGAVHEHPHDLHR